ncbi:hypothetical protein VP01_1270g1 [Puccinia sorghi]|uniref:Uncharacterized protein n=1 Tax=Puccinia sorghi TaxID=27349 RepID=A0A0L6VQH3_9BASI|nr:hypothetical protein VP01_1270g1 [Puccinia sorghi]
MPAPLKVNTSNLPPSTTVPATQHNNTSNPGRMLSSTPISASPTLASDKPLACKTSPIEPLLNSEIQEISGEEFRKTVAQTNGIVKGCLKETMPRSLRQALRNAMDICKNLAKDFQYGKSLPIEGVLKVKPIHKVGRQPPNAQSTPTSQRENLINQFPSTLVFPLQLAMGQKVRQIQQSNPKPVNPLATAHREMIWSHTVWKSAVQLPKRPNLVMESHTKSSSVPSGITTRSTTRGSKSTPAANPSPMKRKENPADYSSENDDEDGTTSPSQEHQEDHPPSDSSADHNSENVNNPSDQSIPFPPLAFSLIIPDFLCKKIHALDTKFCRGCVTKEKWNHGFEGVLYLLAFCLETPKTIKLSTANFIYHTLQKKIGQLPAVDMQHAPAKLPSKLPMFAYVEFLEQSLCNLHSNCALKLG